MENISSRGAIKVNCVDSRQCFAKRDRGDGTFGCSILEPDEKYKRAPYEDGKCPFCKPKMAYTNGVYYPYMPIDDKSRRSWRKKAI